LHRQRLLDLGRRVRAPLLSMPRQQRALAPSVQERVHRHQAMAVVEDRAVARLLPPESAALEVVAREVGVGAGALERWREDAQSRPARGRAWTAGARLEAVITTAALSETGRSVWCREHGVYPAELDKWRASCTSAPADSEDARASPQATRADRKRIKELERDLLRKDRALAETAALLVLSKKLEAIFHRGEDE
jgi:hypothetical protein